MNTSTTHKRTIIGPSFQLLSNWCSMGCAGCGIRVSPPSGSDIVTLETPYINNAIRTLGLIKETIEDMDYEYGMVEQSGGEPSHHPQIVKAVGQIFPDSVHKIITNGLPTKSIYDYCKSRGDQIVLVFSIDHHQVEFNRIRLGNMLNSQLDKAMQTHNKILENLDLFARSNIPVVVSTIISRFNILHYLDFVEWLEERYPNQVQDGLLVPIPVSLVSFGNPNTGKLNPTAEQISSFEEAIHDSRLLTVNRARGWLFGQLIGHYQNKQRVFERGESLDKVMLSPSRYSCEIFRYMISFNFQDEEILRDPKEAIFQGFSCGVKVLGNIGYSLNDQMQNRVPVFNSRPSNMRTNHKYFRTDQIRDYINKKEAVTNDKEKIQMGEMEGYFGDLRNGMCMLDDFDGVWWPFNMYLQGILDEVELGQYWSIFRNQRFIKKLRKARKIQKSMHDKSVGL